MSTEATTVTRSPRSGRLHEQPAQADEPVPKQPKAEKPAKPAKPKPDPKSKWPNAEVEAIATALLKQVDAAFAKLGPMSAANVSSFDALRVACNHNAGQYYLQAKAFPKA